MKPVLSWINRKDLKTWRKKIFDEYTTKQRTGIEKFDDINILIDTDDKLPDDII